ncbi:MAG: TIGR03936 family radical SAM-associated protein [Clostridia bacterium]|nr:TIGR03936 family radical SAM-associated protein [Clostridia bacterium]
MLNVRVIFAKTGTVRYISHLDLSRTMARALRRTDLPVWYTEGFNRHPYVTFAAPLSLGYEGLHEAMDFRLEQDDYPLEQVCPKLNAVLPDGLRALSAAPAVAKPGDVAFAVYRLYLSCPDELVEQLLTQPQITAEKRTKSGAMKTIDIKPYVQQMRRGDGCWEVTLPISSENSLNPSLLLQALRRLQPDEPLTARVVRQQILDKEGRPFR